jgi:hypothetical protein
MEKQQDLSRRRFIAKAAYVPPAILSLAAAPAYAKNGSYKEPPVSIKPPGPPVITPPVIKPPVITPPIIKPPIK